MKKFSPEALYFLHRLIQSVESKGWLSISAAQAGKEQDDEKKVSTYGIPVTALYRGSTVNSEQLKEQLFCAVLNLLKQFCGIYSNIGVPSLPEAFRGVQQCLQCLESTLGSPTTALGSIHSRITATREYIEHQGNKAKQSRRPLDYLAVKPKEIATLEPLIYNTQRTSGRLKIVDPDKQRLKHKVLVKKVKREKRAAVREVRRDNTFLQQARAQELGRVRFEQKQKMKKVMGDLQRERTEQVKEDNSMYKAQREIKQERKARKQSRGSRNVVHKQ